MSTHDPRRSRPGRSGRPADARRTGGDGRGAPAPRGGKKRAKKGGPAKGRAVKKGGSPKGRPARSGEDPRLAGPTQWGRVARRGAGGIDAPDQTRRGEAGPTGGPKSAASRDSRPPRETPPGRSVPTEEDLRRSAAGAVERAREPATRGRKPLGARAQQPLDPATTLARLVGAPRDGRLLKRLEDAGRAFEAERFKDARGLLAPVVKSAPDLPEARELMGLTLYRLGRWADAIEELEAFRDLTASTEQHPVLADCHRALGQWHDVDELWEELGGASPAPEIVTEGRIVVAGAKADQGDVAGAIRMLEKGWKLPKRPRPDHLRRAYALADLYDRAGRTPRARELFGWVARHDPELADVKARLRALS